MFVLLLLVTVPHHTPCQAGGKPLLAVFTDEPISHTYLDRRERKFGSHHGHRHRKKRSETRLNKSASLPQKQRLQDAGLRPMTEGLANGLSSDLSMTGSQWSSDSPASAAAPGFAGEFGVRMPMPSELLQKKLAMQMYRQFSSERITAHQREQEDTKDTFKPQVQFAFH